MNPRALIATVVTVVVTALIFTGWCFVFAATSPPHWILVVLAAAFVATTITYLAIARVIVAVIEVYERFDTLL